MKNYAVLEGIKRQSKDATGRVTFMNIDAVKKTGNHYNIKDILDKMKEHEVKE